MTAEVGRVEDELVKLMTNVGDLSSSTTAAMALVMEKRLYTLAVRGSRVYIPPTKNNIK